MNNSTKPAPAFNPHGLQPREMINPALDTQLASLPADKTDMETDLARFRLYLAAVREADATFDSRPCIPDCVSAAYNRMVTGPLSGSARQHLSVRDFETIRSADQERACGLAAPVAVRLAGSAFA